MHVGKISDKVMDYFRGIFWKEFTFRQEPLKQSLVMQGAADMP